MGTSQEILEVVSPSEKRHLEDQDGADENYPSEGKSEEGDNLA
jgi:hypothetical protein